MCPLGGAPRLSPSALPTLGLSCIPSKRSTGRDLHRPVQWPQSHVATEHLDCGRSELRTCCGVKYRLEFGD